MSQDVGLSVADSGTRYLLTAPPRHHNLTAERGLLWLSNVLNYRHFATCLNYHFATCLNNNHRITEESPTAPDNQADAALGRVPIAFTAILNLFTVYPLHASSEQASTLGLS